MINFESRLEHLKQQFRDDLFKNWSLPKALFHYTTVAGLKGIIESTELFATHYSYMNDGKEILFGDELAVEELERRIKGEKEKWILRTYEECLGKEYGLSSIIKAFDYDIYLVSFSENGNLLDQWRAYGDNGEGYSFGIEPRKLYKKIAGSIITDEDSLAFVKVEYNEDYQRQLINRAISDLHQVLDQTFSSTLSDFENLAMSRTAAMHLGKMLTELSLFFKNPAFQYEQEWRVVKIRWGRNVMAGLSSEALEGVHYRTSKGILVPHLALGFESRTDTNLMPLSHIFIGPKHRVREKQVIQSLKMQLLTKGYMDGSTMPQLEVSNLPYQ